jgi:hypothetical protein
MTTPVMVKFLGRFLGRFPTANEWPRYEVMQQKKTGRFQPNTPASTAD